MSLIPDRRRCERSPDMSLIPDRRRCERSQAFWARGGSRLVISRSATVRSPDWLEVGGLCEERPARGDWGWLGVAGRAESERAVVKF
uniref:Uncharacterized protein n=1 Tax=Fagus sylvatica TaxID=28930 RepID=A0A2N9FXQ2_FAGSY